GQRNHKRNPHFLSTDRSSNRRDTVHASGEWNGAAKAAHRFDNRWQESAAAISERLTMKALYLEKTDGPESVVLTDVETPIPGPGEVRVAVKAASVNHRELFITHGQYPGMVVPTSLGCDGAGVVDMIGEGVTGVSEGDEVVLYPARNWGPNRHAPAADFGLLGMPFAGTIAEYICVPVDNLAPKPAFMSFEEAGAMPLSALTSWRALMFKGRLEAGETLLISGVG